VDFPESEETWVPKKHQQEDCKEEVNESGKTQCEIKEAGQQQKRMETFYSLPMFYYKEGQELTTN
jgi:hypothetical protein